MRLTFGRSVFHKLCHQHSFIVFFKGQENKKRLKAENGVTQRSKMCPHCDTHSCLEAKVCTSNPGIIYDISKDSIIVKPRTMHSSYPVVRAETKTSDIQWIFS